LKFPRLISDLSVSPRASPRRRDFFLQSGPPPLGSGPPGNFFFLPLPDIISPFRHPRWGSDRRPNAFPHTKPFFSFFPIGQGSWPRGFPRPRFFFRQRPLFSRTFPIFLKNSISPSFFFFSPNSPTAANISIAGGPGLRGVGVFSVAKVFFFFGQNSIQNANVSLRSPLGGFSFPHSSGVPLIDF